MPLTPELEKQMEAAVDDILAMFDVDRPPVPVEIMLRNPRAGLWPEIDLTEMSATFLNLQDRYSPRMSAVRLLARNVSRSDWGEAQGLGVIVEESLLIQQFARAIIMPRSLLEQKDRLTNSVEVLSVLFEVPKDDVVSRLKDLGKTK